MRTFSLPFRIDGYGRVASTTDRAKINSDRVRSVLLTSIGERIMRPTFGSLLPQTVFDSFDEALEVAEETVVESFTRFLPDLAFESIEVVAENPQTGELSIQITYRDSLVLNEATSQFVQVDLGGVRQ